MAHLTEGLENTIAELSRENSDLKKQVAELRKLVTEAHGRLAQRRTARCDYIEQISALLFAAHLVRPSKLTGRECSIKAIADAVAHAAQLDQYFERPSA